MNWSISPGPNDKGWEVVMDNHRYLKGSPADIMRDTPDWFRVYLEQPVITSDYDNAIAKTQGRWTDIIDGGIFQARFEQESDLIIFRLAYHGKADISRSIPS